MAVEFNPSKTEVLNLAVSVDRAGDAAAPASPAPVRHDIDAAALHPDDVASFFADQGARASELLLSTCSKSSDGDIPELVTTESAAMDSLKGDVQGYIADVKKNHPELFQKAGSADVLDQWMTGQMSQESEESKKKYLQILAMAKNPSDVLLAMTQHHAQESMVKIGELMGAYKSKMDELDALRAKMDLHGENFTQTDMMKANMNFSKTQGDSMNLFQVIQKEMNNYEQVMQSGQSMYKSDNAGDTMIRNFKDS